MVKQTYRLVLLFVATALFPVACSPTQSVSLTPAAPTVANAGAISASAAPVQSMPTLSPSTGLAPTADPSSTPMPTTTAQTGTSASAVPQSLKDVAASTVYTFLVDPAQTTAEYAVNEVLFGNKQVTQGQTSSVDGQFQLGVKNGQPYVVLSKLTVDLRTLKSDNSFRDQAIRMQWLQSNTYPYAVFVAKQVQGLPADAVQGQAYNLQVTGDMTIRNITKPATFNITVTLKGDTLTGEGTTQLYMKDYGFNPPAILGRFTVSDPVTITIKGVANLVQG